MCICGFTPRFHGLYMYFSMCTTNADFFLYIRVIVSHPLCPRLGLSAQISYFVLAFYSNLWSECDMVNPQNVQALLCHCDNSAVFKERIGRLVDVAFWITGCSGPVHCVRKATACPRKKKRPWSIQDWLTFSLPNNSSKKRISWPSMSLWETLLRARVSEKVTFKQEGVQCPESKWQTLPVSSYDILRLFHHMTFFTRFVI